METTGEHPLEELRDYAETSFKLAKYKVIDKSSAIAGSIFADLVLAACLVFILFFASVTLGYFLGSKLGSDWAGFGCVTLLYALLAIVLAFFRKTIERPIINALIRK